MSRTLDPQGAHLWFALHVRSRHEKIVALALHNKGFEVFLPNWRTKRRWSDRIKEVEFPLFPGYLFCRFELEKRLPILTTPGVVQVIGVGRTPIAVDEAEIAAVQAIVVSRLNSQPWPFMRVGQEVRIHRGPLSGLEGILLAMKKPYKLVVSVSLLQRSVAVEIEDDWVSPIISTHRPGVHDGAAARAPYNVQ